jgi:hypothetical protein
MVILDCNGSNVALVDVDKIELSANSGPQQYLCLTY